MSYYLGPEGFAAFEDFEDLIESELHAARDALQTTVGGYIEAVAVPADESLVLLVNEDGLSLKLPPNPQASAVAPSGCAALTTACS